MGGSKSKSELNFDSSILNQSEINSLVSLTDTSVYNELSSLQTNNSLVTIQTINQNIEVNSFWASVWSTNTNSAKSSIQISISQLTVQEILKKSSIHIIDKLSKAVSNMTIQDFRNVQSNTQQNNFVNSVIGLLGPANKTDTSVAISQVVKNIETITKSSLTNIVSEVLSSTSTVSTLTQSVNQLINNSVKLSSVFGSVHIANENTIYSLQELVIKMKASQQIFDAINASNDFNFESQVLSDLNTITTSKSSSSKESETIGSMISSLFSPLTIAAIVFIVFLGFVVLIFRPPSRNNNNTQTISRKSV